MLNIQKNIPLSQYTTFKVGGPARFFVSVKKEEELVEAIGYARENGLRIFVLGGGSNVLVSDKGFDGLVVKLENKEMKIEDDVLECGAGVVLFDAVKAVAEQGLSGFEWAAGIPGNFGGAVRGNAGAFEGTIADHIESVRVLLPEESGVTLKDLSKKECDFGYRSSFFKKNPRAIVVSAKMKFSKGNREESSAMIKDILQKRMSKQPYDMPSAGSFFQNPKVENQKLVRKFEKDIGAPSLRGEIAAGWLVDQLDLRGKKIGGAMVSEKHGNFLVNAGGAKSEDVVILASFIKQQVREKLGVQLMEEVQYVGF